MQGPLSLKTPLYIPLLLHFRDILISYLLECKNGAAFVFSTLRSIAIRYKTVVARFFPYSPIHILGCQWGSQSHSKCTKANGRFYKENLHIAWVGS